MNPTNVRRNDSSCNSSCTSSFRSTSRPQGLGQKKKLSCAEQMALESPIPSPNMSSKAERGRKISAPPAVMTTEDQQQLQTSCANTDDCNSEKTKVPCEFCNEPCSLEALMRHQVRPLKILSQTRKRLH